jgi:hypothetical protein
VTNQRKSKLHNIAHNNVTYVSKLINIILYKMVFAYELMQFFSVVFLTYLYVHFYPYLKQPPLSPASSQ